MSGDDADHLSQISTLWTQPRTERHSVLTALGKGNPWVSGESSLGRLLGDVELAFQSDPAQRHLEPNLCQCPYLAGVEVAGG